MKIFAAAVALVLTAMAAMAADYPAPKQGEWTARNFKFHTGETLPEVKLHYTTIGDPGGMPVDAQYLLLSEGLGIRHVRLIIGNSMGGMHAWLWGEKHPDFMDALVPMAAQPTAMAARNWMLRRMMLEAIRSDPEYDNGNYVNQ